MNLKDVLANRHSVRRFERTPVPPYLVSAIISLAKTGPSAGAIRAAEVVITKKPVVGYWAPVYLVVCARPEAYVGRYGQRGQGLYALQDATIVAAYIQLIAIDVGLATCWVGAFGERKMRKMLDLDEGLRPIAVLPLGYEATG